MNTDFAARARALLGVRFRPQGRDEETGLDCLGLVIAVFDIPDSCARRDYRLRADHRSELQDGLLRFFRRIRTIARRPGDVMLLEVRADQLHLAVCTDRGFVHADAALGRVVETPGMPRWPVLDIYRFRRRARKV